MQETASGEIQWHNILGRTIDNAIVLMTSAATLTTAVALYTVV